ncbi:hypothetical protein H2200_009293 [Cladophialophora chaetospira]|uniref:Alginate lyase domain-containing protein n=1 Tax=Cladophialophora chaetospira TaxID=386627 RepID=A0AA38X3U3_9EURO|nr:hypothetical protein H2200_009293 [Cladophialophora chaetospira]
MAGQHNRRLVPATVVLDGARLYNIKKNLHGGNAELNTVLSRLVKQADRWLLEGPWSVTSKQQIPPSGDKHDYLSQAPYWWRSDTPDGMPYIRRDGKVNPESLQCPDKTNKSKVFQSSYILALAWFYTGNKAYSIHAAEIIRNWFLAPETRMNPNLDHAQIIPGANSGRAIGIIDFSQQYTGILDAAAILASGAPGWSDAYVAAFRSWNRGYLNWLTHSPFGVEESLEENNHGTFAAMQKAGVSLFLGDIDATLKEVKILRERISREISADGSQPRELARTRSWHYSCFNLVAFTRAACIAQKVGMDLWGCVGAEGQGVHTAVEFLLPYATGSTSWPHPELKFLAFAAYDVVIASAEAGSLQAVAIVDRLRKPPTEDDLWQLRPAPEQLDDVKVKPS